MPCAPAVGALIELALPGGERSQRPERRGDLPDTLQGHPQEVRASTECTLPTVTLTRSFTALPATSPLPSSVL